MRWRTANARRRREQRRLYVYLIFNWGERQTRRRIRIHSRFRSYTQFFDGVPCPEEASVGWTTARTAE